MVDRHLEIVKELNDTYRKKNHDYGNSFSKSFGDFGPSAALVRISDKYYRLVSLMRKKEALVEDESVRDTLLDLANYCIMTVMELEKGEKRG